MQTAVHPWNQMVLPEDVQKVLESAPSVLFAFDSMELMELSLRDAIGGYHEVAYDVPNIGRVTEARVCRVRNGISANYPEAYMRRRDPDCMVIGDELASDKRRFSDRFGTPFRDLREESLAWLKTQDLAVFAFRAGQDSKAIPALAICPLNAGFFAFGLALLQGILTEQEIGDNYTPRAFIFVAPPFRHTHFKGRQMVVHERRDNRHDLFSYNLYPGPSAKKGVYGMLINLGEQEGWVTAHCSTAMVITPYDNQVVIMHEGASGGGKSEMLQHIQRESDGRLLVGENIVTGEQRHITLPRGCEVRPVVDDMALCHRSIASKDKKLRLMDAEDAWFVRVNHIDRYGTDYHLEKMTIEPKAPLLFLNIDAVPDSTALIWEHIEDEPGKRCPNPRVILPRKAVPDVVEGSVTVDIRSFGVRTPPCTKKIPSYGIIGLFHILPPALAWLWRLTAPRGHANPSIVDDSEGIPSEGVGSYWPFATGRRVDQANLLLKQIMATSDSLFILCPNQHIGAWRVGFMPQWLTREYLARRGFSRFRQGQLVTSRCPLLGYSPKTLQIEGTVIGHWFLQVETQPEVGLKAYDAGAAQLYDFFKRELETFLVPDLHPIGKRIIECCMSGGTVEAYETLSKESV
ncbi:MAG: hypothetical protein AMXMBFR84_05330 [Candidatus Hydrogenedentota bacterium]